MASPQRFTAGLSGAGAAMFGGQLIHELTQSSLMTAVIEVIIAAVCLLNPMGLTGFAASVKVGIGGGLLLDAVLRATEQFAGGGS